MEQTDKIKKNSKNLKKKPGLATKNDIFDNCSEPKYNIKLDGYYKQYKNIYNTKNIIQKAM